MPQRLLRPVAEVPSSQLESQHMAAQRNLRLLFWVYSVALFSGTHYPKAQLGVAGDSPDKLIHFLALGVWGMLVWGSGYVRRPVAVLLATLAFSVFDEATQLIPGLGRVFDRYDLVADSMGAVLAMIWVYALSPIKNADSSCLEMDRQSVAVANQIFGSWTNILQIMISASLGSMLGGVLFILVLTPFEVLGVYTLALLGLEIGGLFGIGVSYRFAQQTMMRRMNGVAISPRGILVEIGVITTVFTVVFIPGILIVYPVLSRVKLGDLGIAGIFCALLALLAWWVRSARIRSARSGNYVTSKS